MAAPVSFFRGFGTRFCVTKTRLGHFLLFYLASFVLFGVLRFCLRELAITLIAFDKKGNAVPVQMRFFDRRRKRTLQRTCIRDDFDRS